MQILDETVRLFFDKKEEIYGLWDNFELLEDRYRDKAIKFIDEFYSIFDPNKKTRRRYTAGLRSFSVMERVIQEDIDEAEEKARREELRRKGKGD